MFGCAQFPAGYEFLDNYPQSTCDDSRAAGYVGTVVLVFVSVVGAYVVPTVLIGIVSIKFDKTTRHMEVLEGERKDLKRHLTEARVSVLVSSVPVTTTPLFLHNSFKTIEFLESPPLKIIIIYFQNH